jgi:PRTRC genetic system ThiF family protein
MHSALQALGHPGLFVRAIDPDQVSEANMGRQLFSPADVDSHKCVVLISRINRFFGTEWEAVPLLYNEQNGIPPANITISCVDSGAARKEIKSVITLAALKKDAAAYGGWRETDYLQPYEVPYYWMDFGNMMDRGQVVLGTLKTIAQPKESEFKCLTTLKTVDKLHPDILKDKKGDDQGPSCSLAEALQKQDLFINTNLANMGLGILWKMFRELRIKYHGCYLNLDTMSVNPIKI